MKLRPVIRLLLAVLLVSVQPGVHAEPPAPAADHHQHVFSPAAAALLGSSLPGITAKEIIALLDLAHIERATLLSVAYMRHGLKLHIGNSDERRDPHTRNLWFDVASSAAPNLPAAQAAQMVTRIRQVGATRILYGSDAAAGDTPRPREGWAAFRQLSLTEAEFTQIASNLAPYFPKSKAGKS